MLVAVGLHERVGGNLRRFPTERVRNSANVNVDAAAAAASASSGRSSGASRRSTARQLGSSPTIGVPAARCGARRARERLMRLLATRSCPVEIQVSPQHTGPVGNTTSYPAASSTSTAARPTSGDRWLVKVSGHSTTVPRAAGPVPARPANHDVKVRSAKTGISRSGAIPPIRFATGIRAIRLTSRGALDANRDHSGSQPIDQCDAGRAHGRPA